MTQIEWTHLPGYKGESWNPIVGCSIVSKGCTNCYAMKQAGRIIRMAGGVSHYVGTVSDSKAGPVWTGKVAQASEDTLTAPLRGRKPRCYFVNSMGDLFAENVPEEWIDRVLAVMALSPQHRFIVLTKRPERMRDYLAGLVDEVERWERLGDAAGPHIGNLAYEKAGEAPWPLPNVWLGVSVEDQASADERIPLLLDTPAAIRFISAEPLLGPVDLITVWNGVDATGYGGLDWVITGGESGPDARPMHPDWARSLRDQCAASGVPFFFKQWGEWAPADSCPRADDPHLPGRQCIPTTPKGGANWYSWDGGLSGVFRVGKKAAGHLLDGVEHFNWPVDPAGVPA